MVTLSMISKKKHDGIVQMREGISRQNLVNGDRTHLVKFFVEKGAIMPTHSHKEEQSGYLIKGRMIMTIDGVEHELGEGDSWSIRSHVPHSVSVIEDSVILDIFSPVRIEFF
jgi:quercetin dioxygenase-like cupin family protein